jgi:hypothetical protein
MLMLLSYLEITNNFFITGDYHEDPRKWMKHRVIRRFRIPAVSGLSIAQLLSTLLGCSHTASNVSQDGVKTDDLNAARWMRKADTQGTTKAQYELDEMSCRGLLRRPHKFPPQLHLQASFQAGPC